MTLLEVQTSLQKALTEASEAQAKLDKARQSLEPLETAAAEKQKEVNKLISDFQRLTGAAPVKSGRGGVSGKRAAYRQSVESKISASGKRAYTRAIHKGLKSKEAERLKIEAEQAMAAEARGQSQVKVRTRTGRRADSADLWH
jgi:hypothetical protein